MKSCVVPVSNYCKFSQAELTERQREPMTSGLEPRNKSMPCTFSNSVPETSRCLTPPIPTIFMKRSANGG